MKSLELIFALAAFASTPLSAHDFWIEPLEFEVPTGKPVAVHLRVGEDFRGEAVMPQEHSIIGFDAHDRVGSRPLRTTAAPAVPSVIAARQAGLLAIGYESRPSTITLGAALFEQYLHEEGLDHVIARRAEHGASALPGRELFARSAKSLVHVEGESPSAASLAPLGLPLEFVATTDPYTLTEGSALELELLYRGQPAVDVLVVALPKANPGSAQRGRTDGAGRLTIAIDRPGAWLIKAVYMDAAPADTGADWMSWWASLTFSIPGS